jgi:hypothetical protein
MIIGFTGVKGSGKDTCGQFLVETYEFTRVAFADRLKEAVAILFDISVENVDDYKDDAGGTLPRVQVILDIASKVTLHPSIEYVYSWREFLQRFGTEMGRNTFGKNFWIDQWENYLYQNSIRDDNIVVTDVRFQNEVERIQTMGGTIVEVTRPGYEPDGHESEHPLPRMLIDSQIENNGTIDDLKVDVFELYKGLTRNGS